MKYHKITCGDWAGTIHIDGQTMAIPEGKVIAALKRLGAIPDDYDHPRWHFASDGSINYDDRLPSGRISKAVSQCGWLPVTIEGFEHTYQSAAGYGYWVFLRK